ncbi:MAG: ABC transporter substrate-binding protein [Janthinobacterium lividum]
MRLLARTITAALSVCLLGGGLAQAQSNTLNVGLIYPIKTMLGQEGQRGSEMAADFLNQSGGLIKGEKLHLTVYDDNYTPADGVAAARRLASEDKVKIIVGAINTSVSLGVMQIAQQNGMLYLAAVTKAPAITDYDRAFLFNPLVSVDGATFDKYIKDKVNPQRVAVVVENGDYGRSIVTDMKKYFGDKVVATELYEILKQTDFSTLATRIKAANPDAVCLGFSAPEQGGNVLRALKEAGVGGKRCIMPGSITPDVLKVAGDSAEGAFTVDIWSPTTDNEINRKFVSAFQAKYHEAPSKVDFLGFESVWVLGQAIRKAGTDSDTAKIAQTIRDNAWETPRGTIRFPKNRASSDAWVVMTVKDGKIVSSPINQ